MFIPKHLTDKQKANYIRARALKMERKAEKMISEARGMRQAADAVERAAKVRHSNAGLASVTA